MVAAAHPWLLVGPWYRWDRAAVPADGRRAAPAFQKFNGDSFIEDFVADPQHSLAFDDEIDVVSHVGLLPAAAGGKLAGKLATLFATRADGRPLQPGETLTESLLKNLRRARLTPTDLRKLFLPIHDRHYLVVCELHCDVPGFPSADRAEVCQAGFVVRRRHRVVAPELMDEAALRVQAVRDAEGLVAELRERSPLKGGLGRQRKARLAEMEAGGELATAIAAAERHLAELRRELADWFADNGIGARIEGWFPDRRGARPAETLGRWQPLGDDPDCLDERVYPLYPLIPDPREAAHDAAGRCLYYGVVPAVSSEHDAAGRARFDDRNTYEVRCFVRRHEARCPRTGNAPDCHGRLTWSEPTEPYRLAAPFDLDGSSNRPVTIKMPDLRELAAQAVARPRGSRSPVKFVQPQHLSPKVKDGAVDGGQMGGEAICFFSIPLITLVALFVLNIFLPIVVFLFNLWFLLVFRFCIPPSLSVGAALDAAIAAKPPGVDFDADAALTVGAKTYSAVELNAELKAGLAARIAAEIGEDAGKIGDRLARHSNNALAPLDQSFEDNAAMPQDPAEPPPGQDYAAALVFETRRAPQWRPDAGGRG